MTAKTTHTPHPLDNIPITPLLRRVKALVTAAYQPGDSEETEHAASTRRRTRTILALLYRNPYGNTNDSTNKKHTLEAAKAMPFVFLRTAHHFKTLIGGDLTMAKLHGFRAQMCIVMAREIIENGGWDMEILQTQVLTYKFEPREEFEDSEARHESALTCAVRVEAAEFLTSPILADCVRAIWQGELVLHDSLTFGVRQPLTRKSFPHPFFLLSRAQIPQYQYALSLFLRVCLIAFFSVFVLRAANTDYSAVKEAPQFGAVEGLLYFFVAGFFVENMKGLYESGWLLSRGKLYFWLELVSHLLFVTALGVRIQSLISGEISGFITSVNLMNLNAPLLWFAALNYLDMTQTLGPLIIVFRTIMLNFMVFVVFVTFLFLGFGQSFIAQATMKQKGETYNVTTMMYILWRGWFGMPMFEELSHLNSTFGPFLCIVFQIIGVVAVCLLTATFAETWTRVLANSHEVYFYHFTYRVLDYFSTPMQSHRPLTLPPFNLLNTCILSPLRLCLPKRWVPTLNNTVTCILCFPWALIIFAYERFIVLISLGWLNISKDTEERVDAENQRKNEEQDQQRLAAEAADKAREEIETALATELHLLPESTDMDTNVTALGKDVTTKPETQNDRSEVSPEPMQNEGNATRDTRSYMVNDTSEGNPHPWSVKMSDTDEDGRWKSIQGEMVHLKNCLEKIMEVQQKQVTSNE